VAEEDRWELRQRQQMFLRTSLVETCVQDSVRCLRSDGEQSRREREHSTCAQRWARRRRLTREDCGDQIGDGLRIGGVVGVELAGSAGSRLHRQIRG
jgi:hypothetical protein